MPRVYNFAAGPGTLPLPVLEEVAANCVDYHGEGMSLMIQSICFFLGFIFVAVLSCIGPSAIDAFQLLIMQLLFVLMSLVSVVRAMKY